MKALASRKGDSTIGEKGPSPQARATLTASASERLGRTAARECASTCERKDEVFSRSRSAVRSGLSCLSSDSPRERDSGRDKKWPRPLFADESFGAEHKLGTEARVEGLGRAGSGEET